MENHDLADAVRAALDISGQPTHATAGAQAVAQVARVKAVLKSLDPDGEERFHGLRHAWKDETFGQHYSRNDHHHVPSLLEWLLDKQKRHVIYVKKMVGRKVKLVPVVRPGRDPEAAEMANSMEGAAE